MPLSDAEQGPLWHLRPGPDTDPGVGLPDRRPVHACRHAHRAESQRCRRRQRHGRTGTAGWSKMIQCLKGGL